MASGTRFRGERRLDEANDDLVTSVPTATQSPTKNSASSSSSSSSSSGASSYQSGRHNSNSATPLLTRGETIGALLIGTISALIGLYFLMLFVRIRRWRKKHPRELLYDDDDEEDESYEGDSGTPHRSTRALSQRAQKQRWRLGRKRIEDDDDEAEESSLTILGGIELGAAETTNSEEFLSSQFLNAHNADDASALAIIAIAKKASASSNNNDDDATAETATIELADVSGYTTMSSSDEEDGGEPSSIDSPRRRRRKTRRSSAGCNGSTGLVSEYSSKSRSLTSVVLDAVLPRAACRAPDDETDDGDDMLHTYYRHQQQPHEESTFGTSTAADSRYVPPALQTVPKTPPRLQQKLSRHTRFRSSNHEDASETIVRNCETTTVATDVFSGIVSEEPSRGHSGSPYDPEEELPFDC